MNMIEQFTRELAALHGVSESEAGRGYEDFMTDLTLRLSRYSEGKLYLNSAMAFPRQAPATQDPLNLENLQVPVLPEGGQQLNN